MSNIDKLSDLLLKEITQLEHEIDRIFVLNGHKENTAIKMNKKSIQARKNMIKKLHAVFDE
ncbi:MAG: hypothetical protein KZQ83_06330 [gamma proteobacterium symbiont of Taylorina sp.]|nr:hypothetical protein [gamma proteobacterium symbiont of Taylorina sp.]